MPGESEYKRTLHSLNAALQEAHGNGVHDQQSLSTWKALDFIKHIAPNGIMFIYEPVAGSEWSPSFAGTWEERVAIVPDGFTGWTWSDKDQFWTRQGQCVECQPPKHVPKQGEYIIAQCDNCKKLTKENVCNKTGHQFMHPYSSIKCMYCGYVEVRSS